MRIGSAAGSGGPARGGNDPARPGLEELDAAGVRWCLLRDGHDGSSGGDLDLLVARDDLPELDRVLVEAGSVPVPSWGYGTHRFFLHHDGDRDRWTKLDVVTELSFGGAFSLRSGAEGECLSRRRREAGSWVLHPDDAFWGLLLHRLLDKRTIDEPSAERLRELSARASVDGPLARALAARAPAEWPPSLMLDAARRGSFSELEAKLAPALARSWASRARGGVWRRRSIERIARWVAKPATAWRRRGLAVAVLAPDGGGKSTLIDGLRISFPLPVRSIYLAPFPTRPTGSAPRISGVELVIRLARLWRGWLTGRYHVARGRLVLFDRYPFDARVAPRRPLGAAGRLRRWIIGRSCPAPELVLVLDAPGEVLHGRTGELDPATLESERQQYRSLGSRLRRATVLDATEDADAVRRLAVAIIWRTWTARWRHR
jgi:thymidylate kinase